MSLEKKKTDLINALYFLHKLGAEKPGPIILQFSPTSDGDVTSPVQSGLAVLSDILLGLLWDGGRSSQALGRLFGLP